MKILFTITPAFNPNAGGVQRTTWKLGKYFSEQGIEVFYYSLSHEGHVDVEYGTLYYAPKEGQRGNQANINYLQLILKSVKPHIVINQMPYEKELREILYQEKQYLNYLLLGCLRNSLFNFKNNARERMRQLLPKPTLAFLDNSLGEAMIQLRHRWTHRNDLKAIIDQHDFFILLAPPNRDELAYFVGSYKPDKIVAIPNSIPAVSSVLPAKEKIILHVGRLNIPQKRSDLLVPFWENVSSFLPDWKFVIVGEGPYFKELNEEIKNKKIERIQLEGYQKPEPYYEKAAIFMMPSAYEGFPNTLLEAQSYGCASLAFDNYAALGWIVRDGEDSLLIAPFHVAKMAQGVINLAKDKAALTRMQQKALQNATRFTIDRVGAQWLQFFKAHVKS